MKKKSISINAILYGIKTVLGLLFPLITYPYAARVLHAEYLGRVGYAQSIVSYFALIGAFGISAYAVREGAALREDRKKIQQFSNEIFTVNMIMTAIAYVLLFAVMLLVQQWREYISLAAILSMSILFATLGIDWINVIHEDYFAITVRSIVAQVLNLVLLFLLVKSEQDYYIYAFLTILTTIVVSIWNLIACRKYVHIRITFKCRFLTHFKRLLVFFANGIAGQVYGYAGTTMLGWFKGDVAVGLYSIAVKVYTIVKTLVAAVYTVCIPRLAHFFGTGNIAAFKDLINKITSCIVLVIIPAMAGLCCLAAPIIDILGGAEYVTAVPTLQILAGALLFACFTAILTNCINIPSGKEKICLYASVVGAIVNCLFNAFLIPIWSHYGAAITILVAELAVLIVSFVGNKEMKNYFSWKELLINALHACIGSAVVVAIVLTLSMVIHGSLLLCVVSFVVAVPAYGVILLLLRNPYAKMGVDMCLKKLKVGNRG